MDFDKLHPDTFARMGAYTKQIYRDVYPSIDPASTALSQCGKVVLITGAGSGIGAQGIAPAFAKAGARALVLVGRRRDRIESTALAIRKLFSSVEVMEAPTNISDPKAVDTLFSSIETRFGSVDVLVNNAGVQSGKAPLGESDELKWWTDFEINTRGTYLVTRMFLRSIGAEKQGSIINISSGASRLVMPSVSSYGISKLAVNRMTEYIAAENPNVICVSLDPGSVKTEAAPDMFRKFALDTPELVGGMAVWLTTSKAYFLNGRFVSVNWSVDELVARKKEIIEGNDLKIVVQGKFGIEP